MIRILSANAEMRWDLTRKNMPDLKGLKIVYELLQVTTLYELLEWIPFACTLEIDNFEFTVAF